MRVMVFIKATADSEAGVPPTAEAFEAMDKFGEELVAAGIVEAGAGLQPSMTGKRIQMDGAKRMVTDGPFTETKEIIAGYTIWNVKDMEEAMDWAMKFPNPMPGPSEIELRPLFLWEPSGDTFTADFVEQEK